METLGRQRPNHPVTKPNSGPLALYSKTSLLTQVVVKESTMFIAGAKQRVQAASA